MDIKLVVIVAVLAVLSVEARSVLRCTTYCQNGFLPGSCECKTTNPCAFTLCPVNTRCVPRGPVADCIPLSPPSPLPVGVCGQPKEIGPCRASMLRYYYNSLSRKCERFIYGGCLGNGNNFKTPQDCNSRCTRNNSYY